MSFQLCCACKSQLFFTFEFLSTCTQQPCLPLIMFFVTCPQSFESFDSPGGSLLFSGSFDLSFGEFTMGRRCFASNTFGGPVDIALAFIAHFAVLVSPLFFEPSAQSFLLRFLARVPSTKAFVFLHHKTTFVSRVTKVFVFVSGFFIKFGITDVWQRWHVDI